MGFPLFRWWQLAALLSAASAPAVDACSSFIVNCGDGAIVRGRTVDFSGDLVTHASAKSYPAGSIYAAVPLAPGVPAEQFELQHTLMMMALSPPGAHPLFADGMNSQGLGFGMLWQSNATFFEPYNSSAAANLPAKMNMSLMDVPMYLLGKFSRVSEVRAFLKPENIQITTTAPDRATEAFIAELFANDPAIPSPKDGTIYFGMHYAFFDEAGDGLLLEAIEGGGWTTYDTTVVTNEPVWPVMLEQRAAYTAVDFDDVPGLAGRPKPEFKPYVIPFNFDETSGGYFGSESRNLRLNLTLENCAAYPWPNETWSPGYEGDLSVSPPPASMKALKRAENFLGSVVVPMSQVGGATDFGTQIIYMADATDKVYYYKTPLQNAFHSIDLKALKGVTEQRSFPLGPTQTPFSVDVTSGSNSPVPVPAPSPAPAPAPAPALAPPPSSAGGLRALGSVAFVASVVALFGSLI